MKFQIVFPKVKLILSRVRRVDRCDTWLIRTTEPRLWMGISREQQKRAKDALWSVVNSRVRVQADSRYLIRYPYGKNKV